MRSNWTLFGGFVVLAVSACGGGGSSGGSSAAPTYTVGGTVANLGGTLVLQNNGGNDLSLTTNSAFTFTTALVAGSAYSVTVKTQPPAQVCAVSNGSGTLVSSNVTNVAVSCVTMPAITTQSVGVTVTVGQTATFSIVASGTAPLSYQWKRDGANIANANAASYTTPATVAGDTAAHFSVVVSNSAGAVTSSAALLTVNLVSTHCPLPSGTVVTHTSQIAASETWLGNGIEHRIPASISIVAPATVTIQKCAYVELGAGVEITVMGDPFGTGTAKLVAAGDDANTGVVYFVNADTQRWGQLLGYNKNSIIELNYTSLSGGGNVGGAQRNATISMTGQSNLPDAVLKTNVVQISNMEGAGIYLSDAAFTSDSQALTISGSPDYPLALRAMALGSIPTGDYTGNAHSDALVVENVNIFDNLTIHKRLPIYFNTNGVSVVGLAPTFVPNLTLTLDAGVVLKFEGAAPTLVLVGGQGQGLNDFNAALVAKGTSADPVIFTSAKASPTPGDWAGIWLVTSNGSQLDHVIFEYAGGTSSSVGALNCGPLGAMNQQAANIAPLFVGDGTDLAYVPPSNLITNSTFRNNIGNYAIDSLWQAASFGPVLTNTNTFSSTPAVCKQPRNLDMHGCFATVANDLRGCLAQ